MHQKQIFYKNLIDRDTCNEICLWAKELRSKNILKLRSKKDHNQVEHEGQFAGMRYGTKIKDLGVEPHSAYLRLFNTVANEVRDIIGDEPEESTSVGHSIMYHEYGVTILNHYDNGTKYGDTVYRCNVMINKSMEGGEPTFENVKYSVDVGDMWTNWGDQFIHGTEMTSGDEPRILISLAFKVKRNKENTFKEQDKTLWN